MNYCFVIQQFYLLGKEDEDDAIVHETIRNQLKQDNLEAAGTLEKSLAEFLEIPEEPQFFKSKFHKRDLTCIVISHDSNYIFSASKDCSIVKCKFTNYLFSFNNKAFFISGSIEGGRKGVIHRCTQKGKQGHCTNILSLAISSDFKFLVSIILILYDDVFLKVFY